MKHSRLCVFLIAMTPWSSWAFAGLDMRGQIVCGISPEEAVGYAFQLPPEHDGAWRWVGTQGLAYWHNGHSTAESAATAHEQNPQYVCEVEVMSNLRRKSARLFRLNQPMDEYYPQDNRRWIVGTPADWASTEATDAEGVRAAAAEPTSGRTGSGRTGSGRTGTRQASRGPECSKSRLIALGVLTRSDGRGTLEFRNDNMIQTVNDGDVQSRFEIDYRVSSDSIVYTLRSATGSYQGQTRDLPLRNPGPHTLGCSISGDTLRFGDNIYSARGTRR